MKSINTPRLLGTYKAHCLRTHNTLQDFNLKFLFEIAFRSTTSSQKLGKIVKPKVMTSGTAPKKWIYLRII
jgi:hypothetical protein